MENGGWRMKLGGKVAIVTGASRGLGRVFCLKLAEEGARIVADDIAGLEETVKAVEAMGGTAIALQADVTREEDTLRMARETVEEFGRIDILVNNAAFYYGISRKPFYELDPGEWDRVMEVNVKGPWLCTRAVFPYMKEQGKGSIINLASEVFFTGSRNFAHYVASKGGVIGLTRALAVELGPHGIRINAIAPGFTDTEASRLLVPEMEKKYNTNKTPLRRLEKPEDLAGTVVFLASDDSAFITGQTILVDGGRAMH
jgi:NAD(P)-dependent dehydrogenase (short-subunit alcohol dehydrogenase family)